MSVIHPPALVEQERDPRVTQFVESQFYIVPEPDACDFAGTARELLPLDLVRNVA